MPNSRTPNSLCTNTARLNIIPSNNLYQRTTLSLILTPQVSNGPKKSLGLYCIMHAPLKTGSRPISVLLVLNKRISLKTPLLPSNNSYITLLRIQMMALFIVEVTWFLLPIMTSYFTINPKAASAQVTTNVYLRIILIPDGMYLSSPLPRSSNFP